MPIHHHNSSRQACRLRHATDNRARRTGGDLPATLNAKFRLFKSADVRRDLTNALGGGRWDRYRP